MLQDLAFAMRLLAKNRTFTAATALTLALGLGGTTAMFAVVDAALLAPLPLPEPDRLVWGWGLFPRNDSASVSPPDFVDYRSRARTVRLAAFTAFPSRWALAGAGEPERVPGLLVSAGFFETVGVTPFLGRSFRPEEEQVATAQVAIISEALWRRRFGADASVLGGALAVDGRTVTLVGVAAFPASFPASADVWMPLPLSDGGMQVRRYHFLRLVGRLERGTLPEVAQAELDAIAGALEAEHPDSNRGWRVRLEPLQERIAGPVRPVVLVLFAAVACVLLVACANVANLLLARGGARRREIAVRAALGATRARLARQLLAESLLLALLGGILGWLLAVWATELLGTLRPSELVPVPPTLVAGRVAFFALGLTLATGLLFGLAPARDAARVDLRDALAVRGGTGGHRRARAFLVVAELGLATMLLLGAGLLLRSFSQLLRVDPGFRAEGVLATTLELPEALYPDRQDVLGFAERLLEEARALPGAGTVGLTSRLPLAPQGGDTYFQIEDRPVAEGERPTADIRTATPGFFAAMSVPVIRGRDFSRADRAGAPDVVVVNEAFVRAFFGDEPALGRRLRIDFGREISAEIVGVVGGVRQYGLAFDAPPAMYLAFAQAPSGPLNLVVRGGEAPLAAVAAALKEVVRRLDPGLPYEATAMTDLVARSAAPSRVRALLVGGFAAVAVLLASIGVYGVVAALVSERRRELGIRMALGARLGDVTVLVLREGARLAAIGLSLGLAGGFALSRSLSTLLFGVRPFDLATVAGVAAVVGAAMLAATVGPAWRAARLDPATTLRDE
jgi:putative ABC transport system permease protein